MASELDEAILKAELIKAKNIQLQNENNTLKEVYEISKEIIKRGLCE